MSTRPHQCTCPACANHFTIEVEIDPGDPCFGQDADGNRGVRIDPFLVPPDEVQCPECKLDMTDLVALQLVDIDLTDERWEPEPEDVEDR